MLWKVKTPASLNVTKNLQSKVGEHAHNPLGHTQLHRLMAHSVLHLNADVMSKAVDKEDEKYFLFGKHLFRGTTNS